MPAFRPLLIAALLLTLGAALPAPRAADISAADISAAGVSGSALPAVAFHVVEQVTYVYTPLARR